MSVAGNDSVYRWIPQAHDGRILDTPAITLSRVTTIIGETLAKPQLLNWYYSTVVDNLESLFDVFKDMPKARIMEAATNLDEWLEKNRLRPVDIRDERAEEGTDAHEWLHLLAQGERGITWNMEGAPGSYYGAIDDWWEKTKPDVIASETTLLSLQHGFAGSCDLVANLGPTPRVIIDLKTRRVGQGARDSDHLQLAAYRIAWNEMHPGAPCSPVSYVLAAFDDGTYQMIRSTGYEETFLNLLSVYNSLRRR